LASGEGLVAVVALKQGEDVVLLNDGQGDGSAWGPGDALVRLADPPGEVLHLDVCSTGEGGTTFHRVLEFTDVARPAVVQEAVGDIGREVLDAPLHAEVGRREQESGEGENVHESVAQGWHVKFDNLETVVEVLSERSVEDILSEVSVGGGDDSYIHASGAVLANPSDLALLEDPEELDLHAVRDFPDFVQEEGSLVGGFEESRSVGGSAGEGPPDMAEAFAFEECLGDGAAVDGDEGAGGAGGFVVNEACDAFLAGAALAGNQDRSVDPGDTLCEVDELPHGVAADDESGGIFAPDLHGVQHPQVPLESGLCSLEGISDALQGYVEGLSEAAFFEELQLFGAVIAPLLPGAPHEMARSVTFAYASVLKNKYLFPGYMVPCVPPTWHGFAIRYRFRSTTWRIHLRRTLPDDPPRPVVVDGLPIRTPTCSSWMTDWPTKWSSPTSPAP
jgi:hypothetical protein